MLENLQCDKTDAHEAHTWSRRHVVNGSTFSTTYQCGGVGTLRTFTIRYVDGLHVSFAKTQLDVESWGIRVATEQGDLLIPWHRIVHIEVLP